MQTAAIPIPTILSRAYNIFVEKGNLPSPPKKLNVPKITMERQNAIFVRCLELFAQTNSSVNIGASNAQSQKRLMITARIIRHTIANQFFIVSRIYKIPKQIQSVNSILKP